MRENSIRLADLLTCYAAKRRRLAAPVLERLILENRLVSFGHRTGLIAVVFPEGRLEDSPRGPRRQVFVCGAEDKRSAVLGPHFDRRSRPIGGAAKTLIALGVFMQKPCSRMPDTTEVCLPVLQFIALEEPCACPRAELQEIDGDQKAEPFIGGAP
jgi:hypothetical protein